MSLTHYDLKFFAVSYIFYLCMTVRVFNLASLQKIQLKIVMQTCIGKLQA